MLYFHPTVATICNLFVRRYLLEELEEAAPANTTPTAATLKRKMTATVDDVVPHLGSSADEESMPVTPAADKPKPAKVAKMAANKKTKAPAKNRK